MDIEWISLILTNIPVFNAISLVIAAIGIILAIIFFYRGLRLRIPTYHIRNFNLIKEKVENINELKISYQKRNIKDLSVAKIALWNNGRETIRKEDIASKDPLVLITTPNNEILEAKIIYQRNKANNFSLIPTSTKQKIIIDFDYFDYNEGIILQIFHTGKTKGDIGLQGIIKGYGNIKKIDEPFVFKISQPIDFFVDKLQKKHKKRIIGLFAFITPLLLLASDFLPKNEVKNPLIKNVGLLIVFLLYWSMSYTTLYSRLPKGFESFDDDNLV